MAHVIRHSCLNNQSGISPESVVNNTINADWICRIVLDGVYRLLCYETQWEMPLPVVLRGSYASYY